METHPTTARATADYPFKFSLIRTKSPFSRKRYHDGVNFNVLFIRLKFTVVSALNFKFQ